MTNFVDVLNIPYDHAQEMTEYLNEIDPRNYREYSDWFRLMVRCKYAGVDRKVFIDWCCRDPEYVGDAKKIGKHWDSLKR
jgi:Primase C terminal 2 (PriCT-2)